MNLQKLSISQISKMLKDLEVEDYPNYIGLLQADDRKGVKRISESLQKKYDDYIQEINRIEKLKSFEKSLYLNGYNYIAGVDEVGRGPLAGPVVCCAVVLPIDSKIHCVDDSKKLSPAKRDELYTKILDEALSVSIGMADEKTIDENNIYQATKDSMKEAVYKLEVKPDLVLIDAVKLDDLKVPSKSIIKGDSKCYSIAAASIVAKVTRDRIMEEYHFKYPEYNFKSNKGYGTKDHIDAIKKYGICPIHRLSFLTKIAGEVSEY